MSGHESAALTEAEKRDLHNGVCLSHRATLPGVYVCGPCELAGDAVVEQIKADAYAAGLADRAASTVQADDGLRAAWAHIVRDHDMPPKKDQRGYGYRMGWWDAVVYADRIINRGVRFCDDCPQPTEAMQGLTEKAARPGDLPDDPTPFPGTPFLSPAPTEDRADQSSARPEAVVKAEALREAADALWAIGTDDFCHMHPRDVPQYLRNHAASLATDPEAGGDRG